MYTNRLTFSFICGIIKLYLQRRKIMAKRLYCPNCMRNCESKKGKKGFSAFWCIVTFGAYIPFYMLKKRQCPMCGCKTLEPAKSEEKIRRIRNG